MTNGTSWREHIAAIGGMSETELAHALDEERAGMKRADVLVRLHRRYSKLRTARERAAILDECHAAP